MMISSTLSLPTFFGGTIALDLVPSVENLYGYNFWYSRNQVLNTLTDPGPKLAASTDLYFAYILAIGEEVRWEKQLHDQYGDVVRIGPNSLIYACPEAWKDIAGHRTGGRAENGKDPRFFAPSANGCRSLIASLDTDEHAKVRKVFSNAFSDKALKLQEPIIRNYVNKLLSNIQRDAAANPEIYLDAVKLYNCTTFDIMGDLTFGESLGLLKQSEYTPWVEVIFASLKASIVFRIAREILDIGGLLETLTPKSLKIKQLEHFNYSATRVDKRLAKGSDIGKSDFWKLVLEKGKDKLSLPEMHANAGVFMIAGTETTATLLSGLTYLLLTNPEKMEKVVQEVRTLPAEDLSLEKLPQLPYLNACFSEGLRVYPPAPLGLPRVVARGGAKIAGRWVPEETRVSVPHYAAYHYERNFTRANSFEPERWLPGQVGYEADRKEIFQPFSTGPRNCIGKNLAYHEMRLIMASILWNFDLELSPESKNWIDQKVYVLWEKPELWVKLKPVHA